MSRAPRYGACAPIAAALAALAGVLAVALGGCDAPPGARASINQPGASQPRLIHENGQPDVLELPRSGVAGLTWAAIENASLPGLLETTGQITFDDRRVASIISRVAGRIEQVRVSQWDYVRRGEPIVTLYSPDYMTAEAEYLQAKETARTIAAGGPDNRQFGQSMVDAATRKLELLGMEPAQIAALRNPTPSLTIRSPLSGVVVQNQAVRGAAVNPGDVLYSVGTLDEVWITADIYEDELARVAIGQQLEATTTAYPNDVFHGVIARISPNVDPATHTVQIRCAVENPGLKLKPQMLAVVRIVVRPGSALVVPLDALVFETDAYFAYVDVGNNRVVRRKVAIAAWSREGYARVLAGLHSGDRVATGQSLQINALWHEAHGENS